MKLKMMWKWLFPELPWHHGSLEYHNRMNRETNPKILEYATSAGKAQIKA